MIDEVRHVVVRARCGYVELVGPDCGDCRLRLMENGLRKVNIGVTHATVIPHRTGSTLPHWCRPADGAREYGPESEALTVPYVEPATGRFGTVFGNVG